MLTEEWCELDDFYKLMTTSASINVQLQPTWVTAKIVEKNIIKNGCQEVKKICDKMGVLSCSCVTVLLQDCVLCNATFFLFLCGINQHLDLHGTGIRFFSTTTKKFVSGVDFWGHFGCGEKKVLKHYREVCLEILAA